MLCFNDICKKNSCKCDNFSPEKDDDRTQRMVIFFFYKCSHYFVNLWWFYDIFVVWKLLWLEESLPLDECQMRFFKWKLKIWDLDLTHYPHSFFHYVEARIVARNNITYSHTYKDIDIYCITNGNFEFVGKKL